MKTLIFDPLTEKYFLTSCKREKKIITVTLYRIFGGRFIDSPLISHLDEVSLPCLVDEKYIFNFARGQVAMQVLDSNTQKFVFGRNFTVPDDIYETELPLVMLNEAAREEIIKLFAEAWNRPLPYNSSNITADKLVMMTQFVGYSEKFYNALPVDMQTGHICDEFTALAKRIHEATDIVPIVQSAAIPQTKGVKKIIYSNEALVFYIPLLEWMWALCDGDTKDFVSCLENIVRHNYRPLVYLAGHSEDVKKCIEKFKHITEMSGFRVLSIFRNHPEYLTHYSSLSESRRKKEEELIWSNFKGTRFIGRELSFSDELISNPLDNNSSFEIYTSGAFGFVPCNSLKELRTTGIKLNNCLRNTEDPDIIFGKVFRVYRHNNLVGAVEVNHKKIVQCKAKENKSINTVPGFADAVKEFAKKNNLEFYAATLTRPYFNQVIVPPEEDEAQEMENDIWAYDHLLDDLLL